MSSISIDVKTKPQSTSWQWLQEMWLAGDAIEFVRAIWLFDHLRPIFESTDEPCFEGWTLLSRLSADTKRSKVGIMVSNTLLRNVVLLAKMVTTIDSFTLGRLEIGLGAGWDQKEMLSAGIVFPSASNRLVILDEQCTALRELLQVGTSSFSGSHVHLDEAKSFPLSVQRPHPPFTIGGTGPKMLELVARHADCWNYPGFSVGGFTKKLELLRIATFKIGREKIPIPSTQISISPNFTKETALLISDYVLAGAKRLILYFEHPFSPDTLESTVSKVVEHIDSLHLDLDKQ